MTTEHVEAWKSTLRVSNRTKVKLLTVLNGVFVRARRAYKRRVCVSSLVRPVAH